MDNASTTPAPERRGQAKGTGRFAVSVVAPCYNEEQSVEEFVQRVAAACDAAVGSRYEIVLVNDGSRDATWERIVAIAAQRHSIVGVNLSRNHGHQLAVTAGLGVARGDRVLIIDADLQDPPELLSQMMALMDQGFDVVYGRRRQRAKESRFKLVTASLFYRLLSRISEIDIPRDVGDFRLMSRRIVDRLNEMPEHDRFIRGMVAWLGGRQTELIYDRDPRFAGATKYSLFKMLHFAVSGVTSFSTAPLRVASFFAGIGAIIALSIAIYVMIGFFRGTVEPGWTSLAMIAVFFGISQLGCLSIIGAYLGRTYMQVKGRPLYLINEIVTVPDAGVAAQSPARARPRDPRATV